MTRTTALVTVVSGDAYIRFASDLFASAREHFHPTENVHPIMLTGRDGWPAATMFRHHVLLNAFPSADFVFLVDADMRFEAEVGPEILPPRGLGITATLHPGYVGKSRLELPYETNPESAAFMPLEDGAVYYCGGFVGGERTAMKILSGRVAQIIDLDQQRGYTPVFHDESALNRALWSYPPDRELSPAYCHPDNDSYYREQVWREDYDRKIVALDKTAKVRGRR